MVEALASSPSCASIPLLLCAGWAVPWRPSSGAPQVHRVLSFVMSADLGGHLEVPRKRDPPLKNCFHQNLPMVMSVWRFLDC